MMKVWKYELVGAVAKCKVPSGSQLLSCQLQDDRLQAWFLVDFKARTLEEREFVIVATGQPFESPCLQYVTTVQDSKGLVWHVFEDRAVKRL